MPKSLLLTVSLLALLIGSCTKKKDETPAPTNSTGGTGTLTYVLIDNVYQYSFADGSINKLLDGQSAAPAPDGSLYVLRYDHHFTVNVTAEVHKTNPGGAAPTLLYDTKVPQVDVSCLRLSPNGKYLSYTQTDSAYGASAFAKVLGTLVLDVATKQIKYAVPGLFDAVWTSDNGLIGTGTVLMPGGLPYTRYHAGIYKVAPTFLSVTTINNTLAAPYQPAISPDGSKIAYVSNGHVWVLNADGTGAHQLTTGNKEGVVAVLLARWVEDRLCRQWPVRRHRHRVRFGRGARQQLHPHRSRQPDGQPLASGKRQDPRPGWPGQCRRRVRVALTPATGRAAARV